MFTILSLGIMKKITDRGWLFGTQGYLSRESFLVVQYQSRFYIMNQAVGYQSTKKYLLNSSNKHILLKELPANVKNSVVTLLWITKLESKSTFWKYLLVLFEPWFNFFLLHFSYSLFSSCSYMSQSLSVWRLLLLCNSFGIC